MRKILLYIICFAHSLGLFAQNEAYWKSYFQSRIQNLDPIEGIWSCSNTVTVVDNLGSRSSSNPQYASIAIYKDGNKFKGVKIPADNDISWTFTSSATSVIYLVSLYYSESGAYAKANAVLTGGGLLEFSYDKPIEQLRYECKGCRWDNMGRIWKRFEQQWIKLYPTQADYEKSIPTSSSGTGFAIASNGIIATNYHVVEGAKKIKVRGVNADFNKAYSATVLVSDRKIDLALIQISDYSFTSLGAIPYTIKLGNTSVGKNIFVLGYPLRASMGDEIKLTNGIISSSSGFQGDITSYQISAPVQPGNSGGPLFNSQGNVVGVINAKHAGAENATYAIKSRYLLDLIDLLNKSPTLQTTNYLAGKSLTNQVSMVKKFVYIIETE